MKRNYLIDVIKFVFTILVVISHTYSFIGENTTIITVKLCSSLGWWSVHFFFIVSGMLMVNSAMKHNQKLSSGGEEAWRFVIKKFLSIAAEYWTALFIALVVFVIFNRNISLIEVVTRIIPEMFVMNQAGFKSLEINTASWYISAMLICMLPLYYLLITKKDLYIYVFEVGPIYY